MAKDGMTALARAFAKAGYGGNTKQSEDAHPRPKGEIVQPSATAQGSFADSQGLPSAKKTLTKNAMPKKNHGNLPVSGLSPNWLKEFQRKVPTKPPSREFSHEEYMSIMSNGCLQKTKAITSQPPLAKEKFKVTGDIIPNWENFRYQPLGQFLTFSEDGIRTCLLQSDEAMADAAEIFVGLDFGTSSVKVVLFDANRRIHYAVPFFKIGSGNPYICPSRVYLSGNIYQIEEFRSDGGICIRDIKIVLMEEKEDSRYMQHAAAFLALIIRHARAWLFTEHRDTYINTAIEWSVNLGLPSEKSENTWLSERFTRLALAAVNLAGCQGIITIKRAIRFLDLAEKSIRIGDFASVDMTVPPDLVAVYPEIAAQVVAFVESEKWDAGSHPYITLIDIGAGTVDVSFFSVKANKKKRKFSFFANRVAANGVMNLHRNRAAWLLQSLREVGVLSHETEQFLKDIELPTDRTFPIPESVQSYISGITVDDAQSVDAEFYNKRYHNQVFVVIKKVKKDRVPKGDHWSELLPVFVCGGGSRMNFYSKIVDRLNNQPGVTWLKVRKYSLSEPRQLEAPGLPDGEYDRLSVAYGLSFERVGEIIKSADIPDLVENSPTVQDVEMISKDQC